MSVKLDVRATVIALKFKISFARTHDNESERPYVCKRNGIQIHSAALCWLKQSSHQQVEY